MSRDSFVRELFVGRIDDDALQPFPRLGSGRFRQLEGIFSQLRHHDGRFESAPSVLSGLGLLSKEITWSLPQRARLIQQLAGLDGSLALSLIAHEALGSRIVTTWGSDELGLALQASGGDGDPLCGFALTEASPGSDVSQLQTYAEPLGGGAAYRLSGVKSWVTNAVHATCFVVIARTAKPHAGDKPRLTAFLVDRGPGVTVRPVSSEALPRAGVGEVTFDHVELPASRVIGEVGKGFKVVVRALGEARLLIGAAVLGVCIQAVNDTLARLGSRRAFGREVGQFPSVRERVSRMFAECYATESLVYGAAGVVARTGEGDPVESAVVRLAAARCAARVLEAARELHGAAAFVAESGVVRKWADGRALCLLDGSDFALESFVALEGTRVVREKRVALVGALEHPLGEPRRTLDALGAYAIERVRKTFGGGGSERFPAPLRSMAARLESRAAALGREIEIQIERHGEDLIEMQHVQRRVAIAVTELSTWLCVLSRAATELESHGGSGAGRVVDVSELWSHGAEGRIQRALGELRANDDELRDRIATRGYSDGVYPFDVF